MTAEPGAGEAGRHRPGSLTAMLGESVIVIALALLLSLGVKTWLLQAFYIPSASMQNTLMVGDRVVVDKLVPSHQELKRGDVIVFEDPGHWLPAPLPSRRSALAQALDATLTFVGLLPGEAGNHLVKRVIGLPGDHVVCCDSNEMMTVNGLRLIEPYVAAGDAASLSTFDVIVPAGKVWVMGDHRSDSADSRPHDQGSGGSKGSVPESLIVGRAIAVVWPAGRWTWVHDAADTFAYVPPANPR